MALKAVTSKAASLLAPTPLPTLYADASAKVLPVATKVAASVAAKVLPVAAIVDALVLKNLPPGVTLPSSAPPPSLLIAALLAILFFAVVSHAAHKIHRRRIKAKLLNRDGSVLFRF